MAEDRNSDRLKALEDRIAEARGETPQRSMADEHHSQAHLAWRMVIELVTGLLIGFGIGYGLDSLFGTMPIFLVLFILLGFAAGVLTMMRSARELQNDTTAADKPAEDEGD
jgi:ATP synthase protein I